jgi:hypothetical protein
MSARHFAVFRIAFGGFLALWLATLVPWAADLFGDGGLAGLPEPARYGPRPPSPFAAGLPDAAAPCVLAALASLGALVAAGVWRRTAALGLWLGFVWLHDRNPAFHSPTLAYLGWLSLALTLIPAGEPWRLSRRPSDPGWRLPPGLFGGAWWVLALSYSISGLDKLQSLAWRDGEALRLAMELPWARPGLARSAFLSLPDAAVHALTWAALAAELLCAPLAAWRRSRPLAWGAGLALHLGLLVLMDFPEISLGMLLVHLFAFDDRWLLRTSSARSGSRGRSAFRR